MTAPLIPFGRKSSGEDDALSRERQENATSAWGAANGEELADFVWEPHVSGSKRWQERGLGEAIAAVRRGEASGIVVEEQSRLSRENMRATAEVWEALEQAGARLVCTAEGLDTAQGDHELSFAIRAALAREQWKQYARRMAAVKRSRIEKGIPVGPVPIGYCKGTDKRLELDPLLAPVVRELFERRVAGAGYAALADFLEEKTGRVWSRQAVAAILRNRIYATGRLEYGGVVSDHVAGAIVDEPLWHAAQAVESRRPSRSEGTWLLTGLLRCMNCGHSLAPNRGPSRRRRDPRRGKMDWVATTPTRSYRCPNRACTARAHVSAGRLERWVILQTLDVEHELERVARAPDLSALQARLVKTELRLEQALSPEAQDALGDTWASTVKARRTERDAAARELGEARRDADTSPLDFRLADVVDDLSPEDLRSALGLFWREIRVGRRRATGGTPLKFFGRRLHGTAELDLPTE